MSGAPSWPVVLDDYAQSLDRLEQLLADPDADPGPGFEPPPRGLPVLPPVLAERARALQQRSVALQARLAAAHDGSRRQLALLARTRTDSPGASYVDARA